METFPTMNSNSGKTPMSISDIFKRPGGTFAKITALGAALGLGYGFVKALPFLISAASNFLVFIGELVAIGGILAILTSKQFWKWISLFWLQVNRAVVGAFVKIDPISILEQSIDNMKAKLSSVHENVTVLKSILIKMKNKLEEYNNDMADNIAKLKVQKTKLNDGGLAPNEELRIKMSVGTLNQDIASLNKMITDQTSRINTSEKYQKVMERLEIIASEKIKRSELDLSRTKDAYEQAKAQKSALRSISSIMSGDAQSLEEEMAIEHITDTINLSVAEMERFLDDSSGILENYNLEQEVNDQKVQAILEKYDQLDAFTSFTNNPNIQDVDYEEVKNGTPAVLPKSNGGHRWC